MHARGNQIPGCLCYLVPTDQAGYYLFLTVQLTTLPLTEEATDDEYGQEDDHSSLSLRLSLDNDGFSGPVKVMVACSLS